MTEAIHESPQRHALQMQRQFPARPEVIFRCLTEAAHLGRWFGPKNVRCGRVAVDARVGGAYAIQFINPDGSEIDLEGEFIALEAPSLVQMTWRWRPEAAPGDEDTSGEETLVTIRLSAIGDGTLLRLTHERFHETDERDRHDGGWSSSFDCLDELLSGKDAPK
jgi:uncharacterized protein YndB with AHSA1/START domain